MADKEEVYVTDLYKKHNGKEIFKGFYTIEKKIYQDDGEVVSEGFGLDRAALEVLRAKIMATFINEYPTKDKESDIKGQRNRDRQNSKSILLILQVNINNIYYICDSILVNVDYQKIWFNRFLDDTYTFHRISFIKLAFYSKRTK